MLYAKRPIIVNDMVLWFYLQALLGNGAHLFDAVHRNQRDVEEQMGFFFKLSLSGLKV